MSQKVPFITFAEHREQLCQSGEDAIADGIQEVLASSDKDLIREEITRHDLSLLRSTQLQTQHPWREGLLTWAVWTKARHE